eukprot:CAMPEP_0115328916 /NCGR_PEP_ID=MMETSP0270-20121206/84946_1 /TAXON_ID=71861 /ORGANISM="Scrippsiella trochoidea, Strain CCMP3099" /LENGTH=197 /DNA_ID=CAMNT_0002749491 /DNA_START=926 /DNA_END=1516 /DNA_ORIENTATION=-
MAQVAPKEHDVTLANRDAPWHDTCGTKYVLVCVCENAEVSAGLAATLASKDCLPILMTPGPAKKASVVLVLIRQGYAPLHTLQTQEGGALIEVIVRRSRQRPICWPLECEAVLRAMQLARTIKFFEDSLGQRLPQLPEDPACLVQLHHVPLRMRPRIRVAAALWIPRTRLPPVHGRRHCLDEGPHPVHLSVRFLPAQ